MKTAVIQMNSRNNKLDNIATAINLVEQAISKKAKFIVLPEVFVFRGDLAKISVKNLAEKIPGPTTDVFMDIARRHKVNILMGTIYEKSRLLKKSYNTSVLINTKGHIQAKYRKRNLFNAIIGKKKIIESRVFLAGKNSVLTKIKDLRIGMSICYDLRFPSMYHGYAKQGAHVFCVPSSFTQKTGRVHWEALLRARAIENLCYVIAPNQVGKDSAGNIAYGNSMIVDPWGVVLARASETEEGIIYANLEKDVIKKARSLLPLVNKRS